MDMILIELGIIWNNFIAMELNQQIALILLLIGIYGYNASANSSYTTNIGKNEMTFKKTSYMPGYIIKFIWIFLAFYFDTLWIAVSIMLITFYITFKMQTIFHNYLKLFIPKISEYEKKRLDKKFTLKLMADYLP